MLLYTKESEPEVICWVIPRGTKIGNREKDPWILYTFAVEMSLL